MAPNIEYSQTCDKTIAHVAGSTAIVSHVRVLSNVPTTHACLPVFFSMHHAQLYTSSTQTLHDFLLGHSLEASSLVTLQAGPLNPWEHGVSSVLSEFTVLNDQLWILNSAYDSAVDAVNPT
eukprot:CAMPEP_0204890544 /NCGR_PEP_ID=MMETSP1349-20130617/25486_1 /ASSEMBLY_ACC=CAM_ASM_000710 /TAXON_ID=215587 /ORGANISM="Aplanochytrium stocchinoi, Strain GSBS06" /LENGTH=120 /DNA_ID=CAMNT_0052055383 /DNA_START=866 /DNA_END=1228 /DNA_ORIENTATION=-